MMTVLSYEDDSSSSSDSSDEDDLDLLLFHSMFPDGKQDFSKMNIEDLSEFQCEEMFRQVDFFTDDCMCNY